MKLHIHRVISRGSVRFQKIISSGKIAYGLGAVAVSAVAVFYIFGLFSAHNITMSRPVVLVPQQVGLAQSVPACASAASGASCSSTNVTMTFNYDQSLTYTGSFSGSSSYCAVAVASGGANTSYQYVNLRVVDPSGNTVWSANNQPCTGTVTATFAGTPGQSYTFEVWNGNNQYMSKETVPFTAPNCAPVINGSCGSSINSCSSGSLGATATYANSPNYGQTQYQWWCNGSNGGSNQLCSQVTGTASCANGLNINSYPSCTCPSGQVQSGSSCVTPAPTTPTGSLTVTNCTIPVGGSSCPISFQWSTSNSTIGGNGGELEAFATVGTANCPWNDPYDTAAACQQPPKPAWVQNTNFWDAQSNTVSINAPAGTYNPKLFVADSSGNWSLASSQNATASCASGSSWNGSSCAAGSCANGLNINTYPSCTCPSGQVQSGSSCVASSCSNGLNINSYPSCTCPSGQVQSGSSCVTPAPTTPTGSLTVTNCTIPVGGSSCPISFQWSTSNSTIGGNGGELEAFATVGTANCPWNDPYDTAAACQQPPKPAWVQNTNFWDAQANTVSINAPAGTYNPKLFVADSSGTWSLASSQNATASCASGSSWNGSTCAATVTCVANQGASCTSAANSCGQTNTGTVQCDGSCSATAPSNSSCSSATASISNLTCDSNDNVQISWTSSGTTQSSVHINQVDPSGSEYDFYNMAPGTGNTTGSGSPGTNTFKIYNYNPNLAPNNYPTQGTLLTSQSVSCPVPPTPLTIVSFSASPMRVRKGNTTTVTWQSQGATSCSVTDNTGAVVGTGTSGSATPAVNAQTVYTITCSNANSSVSASQTVSLVPITGEI